jgi:Tfp pilus assembly protein PilV
VWTVIAIVVLLLGLGGALMALSRAQRQLAARQQRESATTAAAPQAASNTNAGREPTADDSAAQAGFQVTGLKLEKTPGSSLVHAVGTLTNRSARKRFGVRIELDLLDAAGQKVGSAKDYQAVIEPNAQWDFKAPVMASKASSAKLASIQEDQ